MDLEVEFPPRDCCASLGGRGAEYARLAERRARVLALIGEFQRALARPRQQADAIRVLQAILACSGAYFSVVESLLDRLTAAGAAPQRDEHRRILAEIQEVLERCSAHDAKPTAAELRHVLDGLVVHEAAIQFRKPGDPA